MNEDIEAVPLDLWETHNQYYKDGDGDLYSVSRLIDIAKGLKPFDLPLIALDLSLVIWVGSNIDQLATHVKAINAADLKYPIILDWYGAIADGRHRIIKALVKGHKTIKAVRLTEVIRPCKPAA